LTSRHNLAVAYHEGGEVRQAVDLLKRALTSRERILGEDHPAACRTRACLVSALDERDNADPPPAS
ncbi:tetratricopeptide repeat protein, partial [Actinomadura kijaniata]|uniref:tetratricopeptide repeat protein n=1 Tax=Actinomadura kijaniata TaxID=46161 RepID=UPI0012F7175E